MIVRRACLIFVGSLLACGGRDPSPPPRPDAPAAIQAEPKAAPKPAQEDPAPAGYLALRFERIVQTPAGSAALLGDESAGRFVTIFIGAWEARAIDLRHGRQRFVRPLTHDLLDQVIDAAEARLVRVQIDGEHDGIYTATITMEQGGKRTALDARPSDAIALALGRRLTIYMKDDLFARTSFTREAMEDHKKGLRRTPFEERTSPPSVGPTSAASEDPSPL